MDHYPSYSVQRPPTPRFSVSQLRLGSAAHLPATLSRDSYRGQPAPAQVRSQHRRNLVALSHIVPLPLNGIGLRFAVGLHRTKCNGTQAPYGYMCCEHRRGATCHLLINLLLLLGFHSRFLGLELAIPKTFGRQAVNVQNTSRWDGGPPQSASLSTPDRPQGCTSQ